ncbi:DksA/TraR family C4-type zinc finger protein [Acerihabitans sp.]|uniref:DksA/TraR family C4-type zinc finger protein n=1 Tax=Acerihabitans sp. TaxID=2811394 RepID=UPI002ED9765D
MASGWAPEGAVQDQIDSTINDAVQRARRSLLKGESAEHCQECGEPIAQARREALPGVRLCVQCQSAQDKKQQAHGGYNRRGSKDSQLR